MSPARTLVAALMGTLYNPRAAAVPPVPQRAPWPCRRPPAAIATRALGT